MTRVEEFKDKLRSLAGCCMDRPQHIPFASIEYIEAWMSAIPGDDNGLGLFRLSDGRWGVLTESEPSGGHGSEGGRWCHSRVTIHPDRRAAVKLGLDQEGRRILGVR